MADKETKLSIVIRTVDQATAKIKAINERLDAAAKPTRDFKKALSELAEKSGLSSVAEGFKGVGEAVKESLFKVLEAAAVIGETVHLVLELCESFETLGKASERIGVTSDYLAGMRDAATRTGASVEDLDSGLEAFGVSLGKARAGTGRMKAFIEKVSPALERQLVAAKSNAEAFDILAGAMAKLQDPAKRSALAAATVGEKLAPLFAKGPKGLQELREHYFGLAGSQEEAVKSATEVGESMKDLHGTMDGIKAAIVKGLGPALKVLVDQLTEWFQGHRADIAEWAKSIGEKLPGAVKQIAEWIGKAYDKVKSFIDAIGGIKNAAIAAAAILAGPLIGALATLGVAIASSPLALELAALLAVIHEIQEFTRAPPKPFGPKEQIRASPHLALQRIRSLPANSVFAKKQDSPIFDLPGPIALPDPGVGVRTDFGDHARSALHGAKSFDPELRKSLAAMVAKSATEAKITVDFSGMPRGARVKTDPQNTADIDLNVGYLTGLTP